MHFIVEIAVCGGYSSRNVHQLVSAVITRAIGAFSAKGIDPQRYDFYILVCVLFTLDFFNSFPDYSQNIISVHFLRMSGLSMLLRRQ